MTQTLFDISKEMQILDELIAETDFDSEEVQDILCEWQEEAAGNLSEKVDNYIALIKMMQARAQVRKDEGNRLLGRARVDENNARRLSEYLLEVLNQREIRKMETPRYKVTVAGKGGKAPLEVEVDPRNLPERFQKIVVEADTQKIRDALAVGELIDGCLLLERGQYLRIS